MRHLYKSRVEVLRLTGRLVNGSPVMAYEKLQTMVDPQLTVPGEMMCRLDMAFIRPGKDQPMAITAGRAPDRVGLLFFDTTNEIKAGDRVRTLSGPVSGTFEIRVMPDPAVDFGAAHHMEVQVIEVAQALAGQFPGASLEE